MSDNLYVFEPQSRTWLSHDRVVFICHGLNLSGSDGDVDQEFASLLMGQLLPGFQNVKGVDYIFKRSTNAEAAAKTMIEHARANHLDAFVVPEAQAPFLTLAFAIAVESPADRAPRAIVVSNDSMKDFRRLVSVGEPPPKRPWWRFWG